MRHYLKAIIIAAVSFYSAYLAVPTISFGRDSKNLLVIIGAMLAVTLLLRPIFSLVLLPINFLTIGSVSLVLNSALIWGLTVYLPGFSVRAFDFKGANIDGFILPPYSFGELGTIILVAAIITFLQKVLQLIFD